ncbi:hypothetical protein H257_05033 [Aphanomyces astaci]|uniref:B30.2/SPRY domain-containing protein n=1 Tax=Aphanomyces astaci TaxID=112090 RepID=W4GSR9_APHAT|nr:hypothetical protein H257_05033 [Aphanomyces astaci]ETV82381.1 hypothetical protein H257_05033 [Aphanomyces astaci]|eukprot:XP_009828050.1 hypothetical protein H257_05033 [Aphanomyces astaci]
MKKDTDALCRFLLSRKHLVMQFLPHPELNLHAELFPWTVEDVQSSLLDLKSPSQVTKCWQCSGAYVAAPPSSWSCSVGGDVQLWHALVHHVPTTAIAVVELSPRPQESSLVQQVALLQNQVLCSMPRDGRTLNIGQVIESSHVLRKPDDAVLYVAHGDGWVFDVDPSDGMVLLEEQVLARDAIPAHPPSLYYSLSATLQEMVQAKESTSTKGWLEFGSVGEGCTVDTPNIVTCESDGQWTTALGNKSIKQGSGIYTWRIQVIKCANVGQILLGLSTKPSCTALTALCIGTTVDSFGWMLTGDFYHCGQRSQHTSTLPLFSSKSIPLLDLIVNTTANTLVVCNADTGEPYGPAYALELAAGAEYFPAVSLFRRHDCVAWKSAILFPSEWSLTQQKQRYVVPAVVPTSMALSCAKEVLGVFREATHHDNNDAVRMRWLGPMVAQFEHVPVDKYARRTRLLDRFDRRHLAPSTVDGGNDR